MIKLQGYRRTDWERMTSVLQYVQPPSDYTVIKELDHQDHPYLTNTGIGIWTTQRCITHTHTHTLFLAPSLSLKHTYTHLHTYKLSVRQTDRQTDRHSPAPLLCGDVLLIRCRARDVEYLMWSLKDRCSSSRRIEWDMTLLWFCWLFVVPSYRNRPCEHSLLLSSLPPRFCLVLSLTPSTLFSLSLSLSHAAYAVWAGAESCCSIALIFSGLHECVCVCGCVGVYVCVCVCVCVCECERERAFMMKREGVGLLLACSAVRIFKKATLEKLLTPHPHPTHITHLEKKLEYK